MEYLDKTGTQELINKMVEYIDDYATGSTNPFLNSVYPVGAMYFTVDTAFDPATTFGGTWERVEDKFIALAGSNYTAGSTGGSDTHRLTINEMPSHAHTFSGNYYTYKNYASATLLAQQAVSKYSSGTFTTTYAGGGDSDGGEAFSIVPSYLGIIGWRRTA